MKVAVIDIGTNTAHLVVAGMDKLTEELTIYYRKRVYTFLGENGLGNIDEDAAERLMNALDSFDSSIKVHGVQKTKVVATEAIRRADNA